VTGYWVVVAIVVLALAATVIAVMRPEPATSVALGVERRVDWHVWSDLAMPPRSETAINPIDWVERVRRSIPHDVAVARINLLQSPLADRTSESKREQDRSAPDVVTCWIGVVDVVDGNSIGDFEARLATLLPQLSAGGAEVILGTLPDLLIEHQLVDPSRAITPIGFDKLRWNTSIARAALAHGCRVVDLSREQVTVAQSDSGHCELTSASQVVIANLFAPYVRAAIEKSEDANAEVAAPTVAPDIGYGLTSR